MTSSVVSFEYQPAKLKYQNIILAWAKMKVFFSTRFFTIFSPILIKLSVCCLLNSQKNWKIKIERKKLNFTKLELNSRWMPSFTQHHETLSSLRREADWARREREVTAREIYQMMTLLCCKNCILNWVFLSHRNTAIPQYSYSSTAIVPHHSATNL